MEDKAEMDNPARPAHAVEMQPATEEALMVEVAESVVMPEMQRTDPMVAVEEGS